MQDGVEMQPASAAVDRTPDLADSVLLTMRQLGVVALPRNYEIFYEALSGSNPELSLEIVSLSKRPTQDELDRIGRKYFAGNHASGIVEHARETLANELEEIASILRNERSHVEKYGRMLDQTISTERVDDIPLLIAHQQRLGIVEAINAVYVPHGNRKGLRLGALLATWLSFILSRRDHRMQRVEPWAAQ